MTPGRPVDLDLSQQPDQDGKIRLRVAGELDLAALAQLDAALSALRDRAADVRLDLSELVFFDAGGIALLLSAITDARRDGQDLELAPELTVPVRRTIELSDIRRLLWPRQRSPHAGVAAGPAQRALAQIRALRDRHDRTNRRLIIRAVQAGARSLDIADALGLSRATLWRRYGEQLRRHQPTPSQQADEVS